MDWVVNGRGSAWRWKQWIRFMFILDVQQECCLHACGSCSERVMMTRSDPACTVAVYVNRYSPPQTSMRTVRPVRDMEPYAMCICLPILCMGDTTLEEAYRVWLHIQLHISVAAHRHLLGSRRSRSARRVSEARRPQGLGEGPAAGAQKWRCTDPKRDYHGLFSGHLTR